MLGIKKDIDTKHQKKRSVTCYQEISARLHEIKNKTVMS